MDCAKCARDALALKRAEKRNKYLERVNRLKDLRIAQLQSENSQNTDSQDSQNIIYNQTILAETILNSAKSPSGQRYSEDTYSFALNVMSQSQSTYNLVRSEFSLPSVQSIRSHYKEEMQSTTHCLTNLKLINNILHDYRNSFNLDSTLSLPSILSVDAICFKPIISITKDGVLTGIENFTQSDTDDIFNPDQLFSHYNDDPSQFEAFLRKHWNRAYSAAFVYQLQPLNSGFPSLVLHIQPATDGKAKEEQINILNSIRIKSLSQHIVIKGYAFDGDSTYRKMHFNYFNLWAQKVIDGSNIFDNSVHDRLRIISDPLHLFKRARYRLLKTLQGCSILAGFDAFSPHIDISAIDSVLKLPSVVFLDSQITKMHDSLPMMLFSLNSLNKLFIHKEIPSLAYFIPWSLFLNAFTVQDISDNIRYDLFEIATYYLLFYHMFLKSIRVDASIGQKKSQNCPHMVLFDENLVIEALNSLHSNVMLMSTIDGEVNQGHIASTPLEHTFGKTRMKCRYKQTLERIINSITIEEINTFSKFEGNQDIKGRISKSVLTNFNPEEYEQSFSYDNRTIARSLCILFSQTDQLMTQQDQWSITNTFLIELFQMESILQVYIPRRTLSSARHNLGVSGGPCNRTKMLAIKNEEKKLINPTLESDMKKRLKSIFGKNVTRPILIQLMMELRVLHQISVPREVLKKTGSMLEWLDQNWSALNPFVLEISRQNQII